MLTRRAIPLVLAALAAPACVAILGAEVLPEASDAGADGGGAVDAATDHADAADAPAPGPCDCPSTQEWAKAFSAPGGVTVAGVAVDSLGHVVVAGGVAGPLDVEGHVLAGAGGSDLDVFVIALDACGEYLWARRFGDGMDQQAIGVSIDPSPANPNAVMLTGAFTGALDFGGKTTQLMAIGPQAFVARLDPGSGDGLDSAAMGMGAAGTSVVAAADGTAFVAGTAGDQADVLAGKLDGPLGVAAEINAACSQCTANVALMPGGGVVIAGGFQHMLDIPQGPSLGSKGGADLYVVSLVPQAMTFGAGNAQSFGDPAAQFAAGVAADEMGNVFVAGGFGGTLDLGGGPTNKMTATGALDVFVASFGPMLMPRWLVAFGGAAGASDQATAIALNDDRLAVVGDFVETLAAGGDTLTSAGDGDVFLLGVAPALGAVTHAEAFGGAGNDHGAGVALDATHAYVAGVITGSATFGCGAVGDGGTSVFVTKRVFP